MYSITRTDYNALTLTFSFIESPTDAGTWAKYKLTKLNPITLVEEDILLSLPDTINYSYVSDGYILIENLEAASVPITLSSDGVYFVYIVDNAVTTKYLIVNTKTITDYLFTSAKDTICCCPTSPCNNSVFANKDYVFNVVSNMSFSFLGWEFENISDEYSTISDTLTGRIDEVCQIIYRLNEYLLNPNFEYSC